MINQRDKSEDFRQAVESLKDWAILFNAALRLSQAAFARLGEELVLFTEAAKPFLEMNAGKKKQPNRGIVRRKDA